MLMPKARVNRHDQHLVNIGQNLFQYGGGSCQD